MLRPGEAIPDATVWPGALEEPLTLGEAIAGGGLVLLCFYPFDWSGGRTDELRLLRDRSADLSAAGIRVVGISLDSPWSHRAWAESLGLGGTVTLLSDGHGEVARAFGVLGDLNGLSMARRSIFLVRNGTIFDAWALTSPLPDVDAIIAASAAS